jgi:hypothetical protein
MTVNLKIENQPIGSDQTPSHMVSKTVMKVFDNPKLVAAWMMLSMLEGHIDMCADYKMTCCLHKRYANAQKTCSPTTSTVCVHPSTK